MNILLAIASQWRAGLFGLAVACALIGGWVVNGWRLEAAKVKDLKAALANEQSERIKSDAARLQMATFLAASEASSHSNIQTVKERIVIHVKDDRSCDLVGITSMLNRARAGLPPTTNDSDGPTATP